MKKTLIALMALAGVATAATIEIEYDVSLGEEAYDGYKSKASDATGWVDLTWKNLTTDNLQTDLALLDIDSEGNYGFNHVGSALNTANKGVDYVNGVLTVIGRSGIGQQTYFASVTDVTTILGDYTADTLTALSVTTTVTNGANSDAWWGLYRMDDTGTLTAILDIKGSGGSVSDLRNKTTETITLSSEQIESILGTDKLVVVYRQTGAGTTLGINSLVYNAVVLVPEPATASLSLLGLAALMLRRRRA